MPKPNGLLRKVLGRLRRSPPAAATADDVRGRRLVLVIECILNQNARDCAAATFPASNFALVELCHAHHVGMLQMPCPEIAALGCKRTRRRGQSIRAALDTPAGRDVCRALALEVADRVEAYLAEGYELLAVLGGNPRSPGCAVVDDDERSDQDTQRKAGVFIAALEAELSKRQREVVFKGVRDCAPELLADDLRWLRERFERPPAAATPSATR